MAKKRPFTEATRRRNIQEPSGKISMVMVMRFMPSVTRSYRDQNDKWQNEVLHISLDDIPRVIAVLRELETKAYEQMQVDYVSRSANGDSESQIPVGAGAAESDNF